MEDNTTITYPYRLPEILDYCAPNPSPEQIANAKAKGFDPYDRLGSGITDLSATDTLAAAATLHDILYTKGGTAFERIQADSNFERDCFILGEATSWEIKILELEKAELFSKLVYLLGPDYWQKVDRNTPETWIQEMTNGVIAQRYINHCARLINKPVPYGEADFGQYVGI